MTRFNDVYKDLFMFFLAVSANYIGGLFNCGLQDLLTQNVYMKHFVGFMLLYFSIVTVYVDQAFHPVYLLGVCSLLYLMFLIFTRCAVPWSLFALMITFISIVVRSSHLYYEKKGVSEKTLKALDLTQTILQGLATGFILLGFFVYLGKKSNEIPTDWSWSRFILGTSKCRFDGAKGRPKSFITYAYDGVRRVVGKDPVP